MTLHIANGSELKKYLTAKCATDQKVIAFNESMITGVCSEEIFSEAFFRLRAASLQVDYDRYAELTVAELADLLPPSPDGIVLWFDADMFCMMNVLTLCAYLDTVNYQGRVELRLIRQNFWQYEKWQDIVFTSYLIDCRGYYAVYRDVLCQKQIQAEEYPVFDELNAGISLYANYISPHGDIRSAIARLVKENRSKQFIIRAISEQYPHYGIGDYNIQLIYQDMI